MRPLPLAIGGMAALLVLKAGMLVAEPGVLARAGRAVVPAALAADEGHAGGKAEGANPEGAKPEGAKPEAAAPAAPAVPAASPAELALLQDLRARREALDARAQALEAREALLAAAERRMGERVEQLSGMQARLEAIEGTRRERDEANWKSLVKTYETMRPRDAAAIFNELDEPVLMQVLDRMKEAKAAAVLGAMQPERARSATTELAKWRTRAPAGAQP